MHSYMKIIEIKMQYLSVTLKNTNLMQIEMGRGMAPGALSCHAPFHPEPKFLDETLMIIFWRLDQRLIIINLFNPFV